MSCQIYNDAMMRYFDGSLNDIEYAQLKQHMKICKKCSDEFESLSSIFSVLETDSMIEPPQNFEEEVMIKINTMEATSRKNTNILLYGIPMILVISLSLILTLRFMGGMTFDALGRAVKSYIPESSTIVTLQCMFNAFYVVMSGLTGTLLQAGLIIVKTYYYVFIMLIVTLFAIQWMFITLLKQNWGGATK